MLKTAWKKDIDGEEPLWLCSRLSFLMNAHFTIVWSEKLLQSSKAFKTGTISETSVWPPYSNDPPNLNAALSWLLQNFLFCQRLPSSEQNRKPEKVTRSTKNRIAQVVVRLLQSSWIRRLLWFTVDIWSKSLKFYRMYLHRFQAQWWLMCDWV